MLEELKLLLGIDDEDDKLSLILKYAKARLKILLGGIEPPESMNHIIVEVSVIRFNRIGSEGMGSHTVDSENISFVDDDFAAFSDEIEAFLALQKEATRGKVRFI